MSQYFHAYRIDHVLGFFRIWENPGDAVTAALGTFRPAVALQRWELEAVGVWDFDRLTLPYVRSHIITEIFGSGMALEVTRITAASRSPCASTR